jgi:peptidoglycan/LPS O-acetylase OafA/YrhL
MGGDRYTATLHQYIINLTMLSEFVRIPAIDGAYWAIFVEMQFYFLVFIVLALRIGRHWERLLILWLAASVLVILCDVSHLKYVKYLKYLLMAKYSPYFIAGAMFYLIYDLGISWSRLFATAIACGWCIWLNASTTSSSYATSFSPIIRAAILASFFLIFLLVSLKRTKWLSTSKWLLLGGLTYPLYLVHQNVGFMLFNVLYPSLNVHLIMWGTVLVMLLFAYAVYTIVEQKYAGRLRRFLA